MKTKTKPTRIIYRAVSPLQEETLRRYVTLAPQEREQLVVELPDAMPVQDAQTLACQALADAWIWREFSKQAIEQIRELSTEKEDLEEGIEELLAKLETYWEKNQ